MIMIKMFIFILFSIHVARVSFIVNNQDGHEKEIPADYEKEVSHQVINTYTDNIIIFYIECSGSESTSDTSLFVWK